jgi:hypothetical protein
MADPDKAAFDNRLSLGAKNIISSSRELFEPAPLAHTQQTARRFAGVLELLLEPAPDYVPAMEEVLEHSRESVRQFIKAGSQIYGDISLALDSV